MEEYLNTTQSKLKSNNYAGLTIVLGNESCDLDSAVSSIVYALFLHWQYQQIKCKVCTRGNRDESIFKDDLFVAMMNVDREDYELKTEVAFTFRQNGIQDSMLTFRNDLDLNELVSTKAVKIVLVDHHTLSINDQFLTQHVTEVIDHRPLDATWSFKPDTRSIVETVGSCCTLIAQRIKDVCALFARDVDFFNAFPVCADMLHTTIILDTVNFSKELNKATAHDEEVTMFLETLLQPSDYESERKRKLELVMAAKSDVSSLSAEQLLRKDVKVVGDFLVPTFPILVQEFFQKQNVLEALNTSLSKRQCSVAVLLGIDIKEGMRRDMAVYSGEKETADQVSNFLENWKSPPFKLASLPSPLSPCRYYKQTNLSATRKQYIPALNEFLTNKS